jgi:hypothetical protein
MKEAERELANLKFGLTWVAASMSCQKCGFEEKDGTDDESWLHDIKCHGDSDAAIAGCGRCAIIRTFRDHTERHAK